jgi:MFS family permease
MGLGRFSHAWRAMRHRNFKLFVSGQSISLIGTWMTRIATSWLVYRLTGSALLLGVVGFSGQILTFVLAPFAGVLIERMDRRKLLVWTQALAAAQSLLMAGLTLARIITIREIIALSALQGLINAFDMPGRQSFLVQMVEDKQDLGNAIAINSSMVNLARLVGPALAGLVIAWVGEGYCFLIDGISYFAVIASLLMMVVTPAEIRRVTTTMVEQL